MKKSVEERIAKAASAHEKMLDKAAEYWRWPVGEATMDLLECGQPVTPASLLAQVQGMKPGMNLPSRGLAEAIDRLQKLLPEPQK